MVRKITLTTLKYFLLQYQLAYRNLIYHKEIGSINCSNLMFNISIDTDELNVIFISRNQCTLLRGTRYNLLVTRGSLWFLAGTPVSFGHKTDYI